MILGIFLIFAFNASSVLAVAGASNQDDYTSIIRNYLNSIDKHDWAAYKAFQTNENITDVSKFLSNTENEKNNVGVFDVISCKLAKLKPLSENDASAYVNIPNYKNKYTDIKTYLAGVDYNVKNENKYYINGINYRLITVGKEDNAPKIIEDSDAPLESIVPKGIGFNDADEKASVDIIKKRYQGIYVNKKGTVLETNIVDPVQYKNEISQRDALENQAPAKIPSSAVGDQIYIITFLLLAALAFVSYKMKAK